MLDDEMGEFSTIIYSGWCHAGLPHRRTPSNADWQIKTDHVPWSWNQAEAGKFRADADRPVPLPEPPRASASPFEGAPRPLRDKGFALAGGIPAFRAALVQAGDAPPPVSPFRRRGPPLPFPAA
jgi:hypothetical protein